MVFHSWQIATGCARAERLLARRRPAVPCVHQELGELPQRALVGADRRRRQVLARAVRYSDHSSTCPADQLPRVLAGELAEPAHQPLPRQRPSPPAAPAPPAAHASPAASPRTSRPPAAAAPPRTPAPGAPHQPGRPPHPPSSPANRNRLKAGSCTRRDHHATSEVRRHRSPRHRGYCGTAAHQATSENSPV